MRLGTIEDLRHALGGTRPGEEPRVGATYAAALKRAAGLTGTRLFDIDQAVKFKRRNPTWTMHGYNKSKKDQPTAAAAISKSDGLSL